VSNLAGVLLAVDENTFAIDGNAAVRLLSAALLGGLVGLEREASDQAAGLRTHIAVALGASLFGVISTLGFLEFDQERANSTIQADVSRVASNVVVGIGFLGAGVIFRQGNTIRNLTTAASLWAVAAVGLACGVGDITTAAVATLVLLGSIVFLRPARSYVRRHWGTRSVTLEVRLRTGADPTATLDALDDVDDVDTTQLAVRKQDGDVVLTTDASGRPGALHRWIARIGALDDVETIGES
jgi:putative Mg2+ transporter-C (MgtC) family protein